MKLIFKQFYYGSQFWGFQFMLADCFGPQARQNMTTGEHGGDNCLTSVPGSKIARKKGSPTTAFMGTVPQMT